MDYLTIQQQINEIKKNPRIAKAMEVFERAQKIYEDSLTAIKIKERRKFSGTYSSTISKKDYYANISTTTR